jgi:hypothetical protein
MRIYQSLLILFLSIHTFAQEKLEITSMKWGADFNIHITFSNDSTTIHDVKALYHTSQNPGMNSELTYYPVMLDPDFIKNLKDKKIDSISQIKKNDTNQTGGYTKTLWSALHPELGGGYIHFVNCLIYAFESGNLNLKSPLMTRPISQWKPNPVTESYLRTKKWDYYVPENQKLAHKEFNIQQKNDELGNILLLPESFITLFKTTDDKDFQTLIQKKDLNKVAIIDMIKLMLGAKYLGKEQIDYVQNAVIKSVMHYNINNLPSVVIFDNYDAAVAMTLDNEGYKIEKVVINNEETLSAEELNSRLEKMEAVVHEINEVNKKVFENKLKSYYNPN